MQYRSLGRADIEVSEIGFGSWGLGGGWGQLNDEEALQSLHRAVDLGVNFIDTAYVYGDGHSETLIGRLLKERSETLYVATKVPPKNFTWPTSDEVPASETFPVDWVIECAETSLKRLGVDAIDLLQLHAWSDRYNDETTWFEAMEKLRDQGKVRFFGVSINDRVPETALRLVQSGRVHAIQLIYNLFHQEPQDQLLPLCAEHGVGAIVRVPFEEGALTGQFRPGMTFDENDWRKDYFNEDWLKQISERVDALQPFLGEEAEDLSTLALKFCLSHPAVSTVIPGMRRIRNVERNVQASDGRLLSDKTLTELKAHNWPHGVQYPWVNAA